MVGEIGSVKQIFVSPHFDDVALSCGGRIISNPARSTDVLVLNVFTSEPAATADQRKGSLALFDSLRSDRDSEDEAAWAEVGVRSLHANLPEALLRRKFPFKFSTTDHDDPIVGEVHQLIADLAAAYPAARFYFPAGFGNHVDHLNCRKAAFRLLDEGRLEQITLYEDIPYCWLKFVRTQHYRRLFEKVSLAQEGRAEAMRREGASLATYLLKKDVPFPRGKMLFPAVYAALFLENILKRGLADQATYTGKLSAIHLDDAQMERKKALIYHYKSQVPMLFGNNPDHLLNVHRDAFSREVTIEVSKRS